VNNTISACYWQTSEGPPSFQDLLTVNGRVFPPSFQPAAPKPNLLRADNFAEICVNDSAAVHMPVNLQCLFANCHCLDVFEPPNPEQLWSQYFGFLSADFAKKQKDNEAWATNNYTSLKMPSRHGKITLKLQDHHLLDHCEELFDRTRDVRGA